MSHSSSKKNRSPIQILFEYSLFLVIGAVGALVWANFDGESHHQVFETDLVALVTGAESHGDDSHGDESHDTESHEGEEHSDETHAEGEESEADGGDTESSEAESSDGEASDEDPAAVAGTAGSDKTDSSDDEAHGEEDHSHAFNLHFIINDILMAFFFAIAGKEVWESLLPGGALSNFRKAATPLLATAGGIVGPVVVYVGGALLLGKFGELGSGWAIPCATDIAFSYLVARVIFGNGHPAIAFLLLLAIADDAAGLVIIAVAYSKPEPVWLLLTVGAMATAFVFHKYFKLQSFWWYLLIPGVMSWFSFYFANIHAALGLVPIIPFMPHAHSDLGIFAREEQSKTDTLNAFEHWWKNPVEVFLGLFGLCNAGVAMSSAGTATWLVLAGLLLGKPIGITIFTLIADKGFKLEIPKGMGYREVLTLGCVAGIGFTVALFVSGAAFDAQVRAGLVPQAVLDAAKMGALASFGAAVLAFVVAKVLGVKPWQGGASQDSDTADNHATPDSGDPHEASGEALSATGAEVS